MLFLSAADRAQWADAIDAALRQELPYAFLGYSTNFSPPDPADNGVQRLQPIEQGPVNHRVTLHTAADFVAEILGFDLTRPLEPADWLTFPTQKLRTLTAGAVYHDGAGLEAVRSRFAFYPHDVWLYLLAAGWARIGQEEHLMGRAGSVGDDVGAALIAARLVRDVMRLCFLMERQYAPYPKWFGTAFSRLACAEELLPHLRRTLHAHSWQEAEAGLVPAYEALARLHNSLGLTPPLPETVRSFWGGPSRLWRCTALPMRCCPKSATRLCSASPRPPIGGIDLISDNTDLLESPPGGLPYATSMPRDAIYACAGLSTRRLGSIFRRSRGYMACLRFAAPVVNA